MAKAFENKVITEKELTEKLIKMIDDFGAKKAEWKRREEDFIEEIGLLKGINNRLVAEFDEQKERFDNYKLHAVETIQELKEEVDHLKLQYNDINDENYRLNKEANEMKVQTQRELSELRHQLDTTRTDLEFELNDKKSELDEVKDRMERQYNIFRQTETKLKAMIEEVEKLEHQMKENESLVVKYKAEKNDKIAE